LKKQQMRKALIDATVYVISHYGLDKATTKLLATQAGLNEVYIYRVFKGKEDLFAKTFTELNLELSEKILTRFEIMDKKEIEIETRCAFFFWAIWNFIISNREKFTCFVQYYYSPYFKKYSFLDHRSSYGAVIERFNPAFCEGTDVWMMLNHILDVMLSFAVKVFNGEMNDSEQTAEYVFNLVYRAAQPHLVWTEKSKAPLFS